MATLPVTIPVNREFSLRERIADHLALMRKFKRILEDVERPGRHAHKFPRPPPGVSGQENEGKWRVQCLLMSAEVRYSLYLQTLERWIASYGLKSPKDKWPLPPWDVAIIFYAHLLSPFNFQSDIESNFQNLWKAEIEFPLARMRSINSDKGSERAWMKEYPNIAYQAVEFTLAGDHAYITTENVMDIHGYKCGSKHCLKKGAYVIQMTEWSKYRVGRAKLTCPGCKTTFTNRAFEPQTLLEFSRAAFGFPIFNLWDSPQRQFGKQGFVDRILALTQAQGQMPDHVFRYLKFLQLMKESKSILVPTLDIDLLWHTHQLSPVAYDKYCKTHVGRRINHVDTIRTTKRSTGLDDTARLWATWYGESYFDPENTAKATEIERRKATCKQKREDMEAKLAAYDYNHQYLKKELDEVSDRIATKRASIRDAHVAASALGATVARVEAAKKSVKPSLRLFELRYYSQTQKQQLRKLEDKRRPLVEDYIHKRREAETLEDEGRDLWRELERHNRKWKEAQKERRLLEQRLAAEVALATEAIGQFNVDGLDRRDDQHQQQYQEDRYDGSWYSVVPSEVQPCMYPIIDTANDGRAKVRTWADTYNPTRSYAGYSGGGGGGGCGGGGGGCGGGGCGGGGCGGS
ncbi:hypothetical protein BGW36DRAFT_422251 [Talaromyces proteolyticus]|uniref:Uncharacterized protein n=1 Tax=Talaromyces proteolyticus TaxID=1131652 RepID=A0AAD4L884_9EURO|nr:uncharacterized protein BGW36DRAFT_422251 [Talaromyces proteolyticus]KAH8705709.1 hypothetical protein BGW36DRAFT_422251 [Talaromyces proteolyticus]